jgi:acyl-coenzyme A thioesterase 13
VALGYTMAFSSTPAASLVTANLTLDFAGTAKIGDWLEARVDVQKRGSRLAFANCYITVSEQRIVRASAVFLVAGQMGA